MYGRTNDSHARLLSQEALDGFYGDEMTETEGHSHPPLPHTAATSVELHLPPSPGPDEVHVIPTPRRGSLPLSPPSRGSGSRHRARGSVSTSGERSGSSRRSAVRSKGSDGAPNMTGIALARSKMFWILFTMMSLCTFLPFFPSSFLPRYADSGSVWLRSL